MECLQNRIESFNKPVRVQNASKTGAAKNIKWPHPPSFIAKPETLAEAGFYFDPSYGDRDNVTCFVCGKELGGWEENDDPFEIHWNKCAKTCAWAVVRCALKDDLDASGRYAFTDKNRLPASKLLEKARQQIYTVGDGWIHDQVRGHGANSKRMAKAGFVFTPEDPGDDLATCLYCSLSLSGWDSTDDPLEEHRKRNGTTCPFFVGTLSSSSSLAASTTAKPTRSSSSSSLNSSKPPPSSRASTATGARGRSRSGMPDIFEDTIEPLAPPAPTKPSSKKASSSSSSKSKSKSRSRSRKTMTAVEEEPEPEDEDENLQEDEEEEVEVKKKSRASTRSASRSVSRNSRKASSSRGRNKKPDPPIVEEEIAEEEEEGTGADEREQEGEEEEAITAATTKSTASKKGTGSSRSRKSTKPKLTTKAVEEEDAEEDGREQETLAKSAKSKKSSKSSSRSQKKKSTVVHSPSIEDYATAPEEAPEDDDNNDDEGEGEGEGEEEDSSPVVQPSKPSGVAKKTGKGKSSTASSRPTNARGSKKVTTVEIDDEEDDDEEEKELGRSTKSKSKKSKASTSSRSTTTATAIKQKSSKKPLSIEVEEDDEDELGREEVEEQEKPKKASASSRATTATAAAKRKKSTKDDFIEEEISEPQPAKSRSKKKPLASSASIISVTTTISTDQDNDEVEEAEAPKKKNSSSRSRAVSKSVPKKTRAQSSRVPEDEEIEEPVVVKSTRPGKERHVAEVEADEDEEMQEVIVPRIEKKVMKGKKKKQVDEDEDAEMEVVSTSSNKPLSSVKSARSVFEKPTRESAGEDEETTLTLKAQPSISEQSAKGKSKSTTKPNTSTKATLATEQPFKPSATIPPSNGWPFGSTTKWEQPASQISSDSDSDVEMEDATIVRKMKKRVSSERIRLPSPPQPQPSRAHTEEATDSEDEVQASLADVDLDDANDADAEMHDDVVTQPQSQPQSPEDRPPVREVPQEQNHQNDHHDDEAISFAPRLVMKSKEQELQRSRTPDLIPFQNVTAESRVVSGFGGESEQNLKTPRTPPKKKNLVFESIVVPSLPTATTRTSVNSRLEPESTADADAKPFTTAPSVSHQQAPTTEKSEEIGSGHKEPTQGEDQPIIPQFTPFLSKLPFTPLQMLSDAELDMTVEEWIRYQMEVEYDRFKRDGERELARFRKGAEEVRKVIEGL
ncbi:hypothetical protein D9756_002189 [Leucocoprinus leucothites]|uniref:Protein bir1 n=1 Tax=Leucocoprinus leucothites TaxID=201217 RepID=A0A8H5GCI7_9AGAR|nr:hypothetical protein D9756_002189 [Leucoagaricus leucothites]